MYLDPIESLFFVEHLFKSLSPFCGNSPAVIESTRENGGSLAYGCFFVTPTHSSLKPLIKKFYNFDEKSFKDVNFSSALTQTLAPSIMEWMTSRVRSFWYMGNNFPPFLRKV